MAPNLRPTAGPIARFIPTPSDAAMEFSLSQEQDELRQSMIEFAKRSLGERLLPGASGVPFRESWQRCADFGIMGLHVPEEYGGSGFDALTTVLALEALGYGCSDNGLLFSIHAQLWAVTTPVMTFGTTQQKERYLTALVSGAAIGAHAMTEPDSGSDAFALRTRAVREGDAYVLNGTKTFVTNAPAADVFLVFATVEPGRGMWGITAFLLDRRFEGLHVSQPFEKLGLRTSPMAEVALQDCVVPVANRLGAEGQGARIFNHSMTWERAFILSSQVGAMERQLEGCIRYAREREQFGRPVGEFQLVAERLAVMKVRLETARLLLYRAAWTRTVGDRRAEQDAALAKLYIAEAALESSLDAVKIHGGYGYMEEYDAARQLSDAVGGVLYSGTSDIQKLLIARSLGFTAT